MIKECDFKSKIGHRHASGYTLTSNQIVCPGELYSLSISIETQI